MEHPGFPCVHRRTAVLLRKDRLGQAQQEEVDFADDVCSDELGSRFWLVARTTTRSSQKLLDRDVQLDNLLAPADFANRGFPSLSLRPPLYPFLYSSHLQGVDY